MFRVRDLSVFAACLVPATAGLVIACSEEATRPSSGDSERMERETVGASRAALAGETFVWRNGCPGVCGAKPSAGEHPIAFDARLGKTMTLAGATFGWDGKTWSTLAPSSGLLASRGGAAMAFHAEMNRMVLFGGDGPSGGTGHYADTWSWDYGASAWGTLTVSTSTTLTGRKNAAMAYDSVHKAIVMFGGEMGTPLDGGGYAGTNLSDTWILKSDGSSGWIWEKQSPGATPPERNNARMVFDSKRGRVLLFGGWGRDPVNFGDGGAKVNGPLNDFWAWDGSTWAAVSSENHPPRRTTFGMSYDAARDRVVVFGGWGVVSGSLTYCDDGAKNCNRLGDTWEFDGTDWAQVSVAASPEPRVGMNMTFDSVRGRSVGFGGWADPNSDDTWEWYTRGGVCGEEAGACPSGTCLGGICCEQATCGECGTCNGAAGAGACSPLPDGTACSNGGSCRTGKCERAATEDGGSDASAPQLGDPVATAPEGGAADAGGDGASSSGGCSAASLHGDGAARGASSALGLVSMALVGAWRRRRRQGQPSSRA